jgi:hypothetical protein
LDGKGKEIPVQTWTDPEVSIKLRITDFKAVGIYMGTTAWRRFLLEKLTVSQPSGNSQQFFVLESS